MSCVPYVLLRWMALMAVVVLSVPAEAQRAVTAARRDGRQTPLMVYEAEGKVNGCAPLAVISHGAGGSENGYRYLAKGMAGAGYTAVVMGHRESGLAALRSDIRSYGMLAGVAALVKDTNAESMRLEDVGAALAWAESQCRGGRIPFRVLLGHSMGAETVMLELGVKNTIGVTYPPAGRNRFDAYVALSPEGSGVIFPDRAWETIRRPVLVMTGTRDQSLKGGPESRQMPWKEMPGAKGGCQWMGVIDGATHMNFGGNGPEAEKVDAMVMGTVQNFLAGVKAGVCTLPAVQIGMTLQGK